MIGVALIAAIISYVVFRAIRSPEHKAAAPAATVADTSTTTSSTTTLPSGPAITQAQLDRLAASLVPYIERTRQLTFTGQPHPVLDDDASYAKAFDAFVQRDAALMRRLSDPFKILGLNPNDAELPQALRVFYGNRTVAFYDTKNNVLHVRAVPATPYLSTMLVVGLTEQLDDQHFTTDRVDETRAFGDEVVGLRTLIQGDAWRIASAWISTRPAAEQSQANAELKARRGGDADTARVPVALSAWLRMPIDLGVNFTQNLVTSTTSAPLDASFKQPPDGSAEVTSPGRFQAPVPQLEVAPPKVGGKVKASGTFGSFLLDQVLETVVSDQVLPLAMSGYRGDSLVVYSKGKGSCIRLDVTTGDSSVKNMHDALSTWASKRTGKVSLQPDARRPGQKVIRLDACSPGAGETGTTSTTMPARGHDSSSTVPGRPLP